VPEPLRINNVYLFFQNTFVDFLIFIFRSRTVENGSRGTRIDHPPRHEISWPRARVYLAYTCGRPGNTGPQHCHIDPHHTPFWTKSTRTTNRPEALVLSLHSDFGSRMTLVFGYFGLRGLFVRFPLFARRTDGPDTNARFHCDAHAKSKTSKRGGRRRT